MDIKRTVLVVEDEEDLQAVIKFRLEAAGFNVLIASNGQEGLQQVYALRPELVVTDVLMPVMDGFTFYKALKKDPSTKHIPVIILTARGKMEDTFKVVGVDEFFVKPFDPVALVEKIHQLLERFEVKPQTPEVSSPSTAPQEARQKRVLVAGDDDQTVEMMAELLRRQGCHVDFVQVGAQLISKAVLFLPNVIILDVMLEGFESDENIRVLRKMPQFEKAAIITYSFYRLSDLGSEDVRQRALKVDNAQALCAEAGADLFIGAF